MIRAGLILVLLIVVAMPAQAVDLPNTTAGKTLAAWLEALEHADDEAAVRAFIEKNLGERLMSRMPIEDHVAMFQQIAGDLAGAEPVAVDLDTDLEVAVVCKLPSNDYARVSMRLEENPPHRIDGLGVREAEPPGSGPAVAANDDALVKAVRAYIDSIAPWTSDRGSRDNARRGYGYGFTLRETDDGVHTFGHAGGFPGINGLLDIYPDLGYTVAALSNMDGGAEKVAGRIRGMLPRK